MTDYSWLIIVLPFLYFLPLFVALLRGKRNWVAIGLVNLFLGWTALGWLVAIIWASLHDAPERDF